MPSVYYSRRQNKHQYSEKARERQNRARYLVPFDALVEIVGEKKAIQLCRLFPRGTLPSIERILLHKRAERMWQEWLGQRTVAEIAMKYHVPKSTVQFILERFRQAAHKTQKRPSPQPGVQRLV